MLNLPSVGETAFKGVENIHYKSNQSNFERLNNDFKNFTRTNKDSFVKEASVNKEKINETNDGKFSFKVALKNFVKGVVSPLVIMAKHPVATLGTLIGIGVACAVAPVLGPILTVGFGAVSAWQLGKSTYNAISNYSKGKYDQAEKDCENVGQGFIGTVLTVLGLKQSAKVAAEAKVMAKTGGIITNAEKSAIAETVSKGGLWGALKENVSLLTTKTGWKAIWAQVKPSAVKNKVVGIYKNIKALRHPETAERKNPAIEQFKRSPEGLRRAKMSDKQIQAEVQAKFDKAFDEIGIPKEQRPKLVIESQSPEKAGAYSSSKHTMTVNPESYKSGVAEIDDIVMHEATHCKEAMCRASLPKDRVHKIAVEELTSRVTNGESEKIIVSGGWFGPETMSPPKMPKAMQKDFIHFAKTHLYNSDDALRKQLYEHSMLRGEAAQKAEQAISPFLKELKGLMDKHPEFAKGYETEAEAFKALEKYALSHKTRYMLLNKTEIPNYTPKPLSAKETLYAEKSLRENLSCTEGNARQQGIGGMVDGLLGSRDSYNQYQFSAEEVLAQQRGNNFLIKNCKAELAKLKKSGTLTPEREAYLNSTIKRAEATIAYKTKGHEYYKLYEQHINNPDDAKIAAKLDVMKVELEKLAYEMNGSKPPVLDEALSSINFPANGFYEFTQVYD